MIEAAGWNGLEVTPQLSCPNWKQKPLITAWLNYEGRGYDNTYLEKDITLAYNFVAYSMGEEPLYVYAIPYDAGILFYAYVEEGQDGIHATIRHEQAKESILDDTSYLQMLAAIQTTTRQTSIDWLAGGKVQGACETKYDRAAATLKAIIQVIKEQ